MYSQVFKLFVGKQTQNEQRGGGRRRRLLLYRRTCREIERVLAFSTKEKVLYLPTAIPHFVSRVSGKKKKKRFNIINRERLRKALSIWS
jgi:hypothetical protein